MSEFMLKMKEKVTCGLVGGSDLNKIAEQMGGLEGEAVVVVVGSGEGGAGKV